MEAKSFDPKSASFKQELRQRLTPLQYHVTQERGTERYTIPSISIGHTFSSGFSSQTPNELSHRSLDGIPAT